MALTFDQLVQLLTPQAGALAVTGQSLETDAVAAMFEGLLANSTLSLTGAVSVSNTQQQSVAVTGALVPATAFGIQAGNLTQSVWTLLAGGDVTVTLTIEPRDPEWSLTEAFPVLANSMFTSIAFSGAQLTLDSTQPYALPADFRSSFGYAADIPQVASGLTKYLSFSSSASFQGPGAALSAFFTTPFTVSGPIEVYFLANPVLNGQIQAYPQMCLNLTSDSGETLPIGGYTFSFSLQLASPLIEFYDSDANQVGVLPAAVLAVRTNFVSGSVTIPLTALFSAGATSTVVFYAGQIASAQQISTSELSSLVGGADVGTFLGNVPGLPDFVTVELQTASLTMTLTPLAITDITIAVAAVLDGSSWDLFDGVLTMATLGVQVSANFSSGSPALSGAIFGGVALYGSRVSLSAWADLPGTNFAVTLSETADIDIGAFLDKYLGIQMQWTIDGATFQVSGNILQGNYWLQGTVIEDWVIFGTSSNGLTLESIYANLGYTAGAVSGGVTATLTLQNAGVTLSAAYNPDGTWQFDGQTLPGQTIDLTQLLEQVATIFGITINAPLPTVNLNQLAVGFNTGTSDFSFFGEVSAPALSFNLTNLPLVGNYLSPADTISIQNLQFAVDSSVTAQVRNTYVGVVIVVGLGETDSVSLQIPIVGTPPAPSPVFRGQPPDANLLSPAPRPGRRKAIAPPLPSAATSGGSTYPSNGAGVWISIQKTFGPISMQKVGFSITEDGLAVQFDCSISVSGITLDAIGLGVAIELTPPYTPTFTLQGAGVSIQWDSMTFTGTVLAVSSTEYDGSIAIQLGDFGLSALASYSTTNPPSFLLFAMLDFPLGGIPAFFVTGLAAGFGFNRNLILPPITGVASYPLVAGALPGSSNPFGANPSIEKFIEVMAADMAPSVGEYWAAAGIRFTTYDTLNSYALATVSWGTELQIGLLGMSTLIVPPNPEGAPESPVVAFAQLAIEAVITPSEGSLQICAQLTPNSYVISQQCKLTGGFAFYLWFPPNQYAWQFVVTLGGYNPYFEVPNYYPTVPILGVSIPLDILTIKGGLYFAMTSHMVMMGISVSSTWVAGPFKAWFSLSADFLIQWAPFYYDIRAGASVGVSGTFDILGVRISMTISVGATLHIWGPAFSISGTVDLVVFKFNFSYGSGPATAPPPLSWSDFQSTFLAGAPPASQIAAPRRGMPADSAPAQAVVTVSISSGIIKNLVGQGAEVDYIVDPQLFQLTAQTQIPAKVITYNAASQTVAWNTDFGVAPMSVSSGDFESTFAIKVTLDGADYSLVVTPALGPAPKGLWYPETDLSSALNDSADVNNTALGITLSPPLFTPDHSLPIDVATLLFQKEQSESWNWGTPTVPDSDPWGGDNPITELTGTINSEPAAGVRIAAVIDLMANGFPVSAAINTTALADAGTLNLLAPPILSYLGENAKFSS